MMRPGAILMACLLAGPFVTVATGQQSTAAPAVLQARQQVIGDMIRAGLITSVLQGPPGILRASTGNQFVSSPSKEFYFAKLANAYFGWAPSGSPVVVELYNQRGEKFGEYADGMFSLGPAFSSPHECTVGEAGCPAVAARPAPSYGAPAPQIAAQRPLASVAPAVRPQDVPPSPNHRVDTIYVEGIQGDATSKKGNVAELRPGDAGYKDGGTATLLSFLITGAGQIYTGETGTGLLYFLTSTAAIGAGVAATNWNCFDCDYTPALVGLSVGAAIWIGSIIDAGPSARRQNRKLAAARQSAFAPIIETSPERVRLGLTFALPQ
jgi:hypothetical protein